MQLTVFFGAARDATVTIVRALRRHSVPLVLPLLLIAGLIIASTLHAYRPEVVAATEITKKKAILLAENSKLRSEISALIARPVLKRIETDDPPPAARSVGESSGACVPDDDDWLRSWQRGSATPGRSAPARAVSTP
jgi:hypothetical protein